METCSATLASASPEGVVVALTGHVNADNAGLLEDQIRQVRDANPAGGLTLDADGLSYISSAGLRVIMRLLKAEGSLTLTNASSDVYDVFEMTGLTELMRVQRRPREISVEGCEVIGHGGFGTVYRIDPETIVKVYRAGMPRSILDDERAMAQRAFLLGVPTAISYDVVRVGDAFGLVFELLDAKTLASVIHADPASVVTYGARCARLLKEIHGISPAAGYLPDAREKFLVWVDDIADYIEPEEAALVKDYVSDKVPDGNSFLHGDFHCKNIMEVGGELMLLDIGDATCGHPAFDLAQILFSQTIMPKTTKSVERATDLLGFAPEVAERFWGVLASTYLGTTDPSEIGRVSRMLTPLALLQLAFHATKYTTGDAERTRGVIDRLFRGQLLPAIRAAVPIEL